MNAILAQKTIRGRREVLRQMASGVGVDGVYAAILGQIMRQDGEKAKLGMGVLMWVLQSERPLAPEELRYALAIGGGRTEPDLEDVPTMETTLSCCLGLAIVDEGGSRVRLIHLTLEEYLGRHPDLFSNSHPRMAEVCLTYLNTPTIQNLPHNLWEHLGMVPFLDYASCYWGVHARKALTEHTKSLALQLLDGYDHHVSSKILQVNQRSRAYYEGQHIPSRFSGLHAIACFGIAEIATALIKLGGCDVNGRDSLGCTPLMWAARNNNRGVCEVLLELGNADPNIEDSRGETPLLIASADGHDAIVKLLLGRKEVNPDSLNSGGITPLSVAAQNGHKDIVKLFCERKEVNSGSHDNGDQTLLPQAAEDGHENVVELGPEPQCINPGTPEAYIQKTSSPLSSPSGFTHRQGTHPLPSSDNGFQSQSPTPKDDTGDPKKRHPDSAQRGYALHKACYKWFAKCCDKR